MFRNIYKGQALVPDAVIYRVDIYAGEKNGGRNVAGS